MSWSLYAAVWAATALETMRLYTFVAGRLRKVVGWRQKVLSFSSWILTLFILRAVLAQP